ncbi:MAG: molybdenum cofactor biosynthesis protein MoaA, partial [Candidatus Bathyarchaeia archaeon]
FDLQLRSLEKLVKAGVSCHPSVMAAFSPGENLEMLVERLGRISPRLAGELEIEELILYLHVLERIQKCGLKYYIAYTPEGTPAEQV